MFFYIEYFIELRIPQVFVFFKNNELEIKWMEIKWARNIENCVRFLNILRIYYFNTNQINFGPSYSTFVVR